jgi:hypothetical protein
VNQITIPQYFLDKNWNSLEELDTNIYILENELQKKSILMKFSISQEQGIEQLKLLSGCFSSPVPLELEELEDEIRVTRGNANIAYSLNSFYERDIKKQKRKRCLAMANMCRAEMVFWDNYGAKHFDEKYANRKLDHFGKWGQRWLSLYYKFQ